MGFCHGCPKFLFSPFCFASPEIIGVKVDYREKNFLTPYIGVCGFFLSVKFATTLLAYLARENKFFEQAKIDNKMSQLHNHTKDVRFILFQVLFTGYRESSK